MSAKKLEFVLLPSIESFSGVAMFNACLLHNLPDAPAKDLEHAFEIMVFPNKESVAFCCINAAQKNEWVSELTHLIDKSLQDASKKLKQSSTNSLPSPQAKQESPPSVMSNAPVPVRKKAIGGGSLIRTTKVTKEREREKKKVFSHTCSRHL